MTPGGGLQNVNEYYSAINIWGFSSPPMVEKCGLKQTKWERQRIGSRKSALKPGFPKGFPAHFPLKPILGPKGDGHGHSNPESLGAQRCP